MVPANGLHVIFTVAVNSGVTALRALACWLCVLAAANAGVVQGAVVEHASGRPMARTRVRLQPVPKAGVDIKPLIVRAGISGHFIFPAVPEGLYLLTAIRDHYFPASYGQRLPYGQGTPIQVTTGSDLFAELRMRRMGAITGRVLDENGIGLPDVNVVAYRTRLPLRIAGSALSDDRGVYRIHGLDPGKYWVRTGALTLDDGSGFLPTFAPEAMESHEARIYPVVVDAEMSDADLRPVPGALLHLTVSPQCQPMGAPVMVAVSSETGRRGGNTFCGAAYRFDGLAPAGYEVYAETLDGTEFGFTEMLLNHDELATVVMVPPPRVNIVFEGLNGVTDARPDVTLTVRRQDLAGTGPEREIKPPQTTLQPGHWEIRARTGPGEYVESIANTYGGPRRSIRRERPTDSFDVFIETRLQASIKVVFSSTAGTIAGNVRTAGKPEPGIPVFLWPVAEQARRSLGGQLRIISDVNGAFRFDSLPPGDYRLLATFDLNEADEESMEMARAGTVHVEASQTTNVGVAPWLGLY
jgi:hypothetical protein